MSVSAAFLATLEQKLGAPYIWGNTGQRGGFDCSGLIVASLREMGYDVPRLTAAGFSAKGEHVPYDQTKPGDFLFFGPSESRVTHVAIVSTVLPTGEREIIHAFGRTMRVQKSILERELDSDGTPLKGYMLTARRLSVRIQS